MSKFKSSISKLAAVASVLGLAACGGSQPAQPATPSSAQANQSSSQPYGSTMGQQSSEPTGSETSGSTYGSQGTVGSGAYAGSSEHGATSGTTGGTQSGMGQSGMGTSGSTQSGTMSQGGTMGTTGATNTMGGSMDVSNLDDAQVAAVVQALNSGEIQQAQLAQSKAKSPDVKRFAQKMITAHRDMQTSDAALFSRLQITPSDNAVSNQLKTDVQNNMSTLQSMTGRDFDRDYIDGQVRAHNRALELVDRMAMNVKSSELRTSLQNARTKIEQHLRDAERIQQTLSQGQQAPSTH